MILLVAGVLLWSGAHLFKRAAPAARARMGDPGKGLVALLLVASVVMMWLGYRWAPHVPVWYPPEFLKHVNNLLMLFAFYLFGVGAAKGLLAARIRHPQLTAVKIWAVAHLLVNGDVKSFVLFGGLLIWAVVEVIVINPVPALGPTDRRVDRGRREGRRDRAGLDGGRPDDPRLAGRLALRRRAPVTARTCRQGTRPA